MKKVFITLAVIAFAAGLGSKRVEAGCLNGIATGAAIGGLWFRGSVATMTRTGADTAITGAGQSYNPRRWVGAAALTTFRAVTIKFALIGAAAGGTIGGIVDIADGELCD